MTRRTLLIRAVITAVLILSAPAIGLACPICFQIEEGPVVSGVRAAVGVLMGVTTVVLVGFGMFAVRLARASAEPENQGTREPE